jgi:2-polyprenyl-6-methoxyphenol hydroxylase-like FAD-dependent oxidoreductase
VTNLQSNTRKALVVGAGIAGLATASALHRAGWHPVLVERAPARRRGGYFIAMFGCGRIAADRLGMKGMRDRGPRSSQTLRYDRSNNQRPGFGFQDVPNKPWMMLRGDVEQSAYEALPNEVQIRFCTTPTAIEQDANGVTVTLQDTSTNTVSAERFDVVVGADGLRSTVRRLLWGPHEHYLRRLGFMICAFELTTPLPGVAQHNGATLGEQGRSFWVFPFTDRAPTVLFSYSTDDVDGEFARVRQLGGVAARLREAYGPEPLGEMMEAALRQLEQADEFLFDSVEQAQVDSWHRGRVVLIGDAAWCPTLYSGMGATSSLAGADALGIALKRNPADIEAAFHTWELTMRPAIASFQKAGLAMRALFTQISTGEQRRQERAITARQLMLKVPFLVTLLTRSKAFRQRNEDLAASLLT